jgi:hypothetical protein
MTDHVPSASRANATSIGQRVRDTLLVAGDGLTLGQRIAGLFRSRTPKERADRYRVRAARKRLAAGRALTIGGMDRRLARAVALDREADLLDPR